MPNNDATTPDEVKTDPADKNSPTKQTAPGDVVVTAEKINELANERKAAEQAAQDKQPQEAEKSGPFEKKKEQAAPVAEEQAATAKAAQRGRPPKDKGDQPGQDKTVEPPAAKKQREGRPPKGSGPSTKDKATAAKEKTPAPAKEEKKEPDGPTLKERKEKMEQELREKYGIPKSEKPALPWVAPETEQVVRIEHDKLHAFKNHTFKVEKDTKFMAFVASIKAQGVTQPVIVRPDGKDSYEIISGHRRDLGGIEAGIPYSPCIVRGLNDEQAIQQMVEDNVNNRDISTMELARSLNAQLESIKRQGARDTLAGKDLAADAVENVGKRSNEIIAERNGISVKQVQRHIALLKLTPALQEYVDGKLTSDGKKVMTLGFTPAFELSYIKPDNQNYIAVSIEGNQSTPSLSQVQRMRELDKTGVLNPDMIDGILMEQKKEVDKVILSSQELSQEFGKNMQPREMKDKIIELLEAYKSQQHDIAAPEKKPAQQEK